MGIKSTEATTIARAFRRQHGLCVECGSRLDRDGICCSFCTERKRLRNIVIRKELVEKGLCIDCKKPNDRLPKVKCSACAEYDTKIRDKSIAQKKAKGECLKCTNPAVEGHTMCQSCLDKKKEYFYSHKLNKIEK